jgi:hypothetical protein
MDLSSLGFGHLSVSVRRLVEGQPTLRDQFAMAALTGLWAGEGCAERNSGEYATTEQAAKLAYIQADAMMERRESQAKGG